MSARQWPDESPSASSAVLGKTCGAAVSMQVFKAYCDKKSIEQTAVRFVFDGQRVTGTATPESVSTSGGLLGQPGTRAACSDQPSNFMRSMPHYLQLHMQSAFDQLCCRASTHNSHGQLCTCWWVVLSLCLLSYSCALTVACTMHVWFVLCMPAACADYFHACVVAAAGHGGWRDH